MSPETDIVLFLDWLKTKGFANDCLEIRLISSDTEYRGIVAQKTIYTNEIFMKIPENLIITAATVFRIHDLKSAIMKHSGLLQPSDALCLFIMCEKLKGANSEWCPYINVLPSSYLNPIAWSDLTGCLHLFPPKVKEALLSQITEVAHVRKRVEKVFTTWLSESAHLLPSANRNLIQFGFDEMLFLWAWTTVNTRCIYKDNVINEYFNNIEGDTIAMVPFLDMINHTTDPKVTANFSKKTKCFELTLTTGIVPENSEVLISYGTHSNSKLFVEYGFVLAENSNNAIKFDVDDILPILKEYKNENGQLISSKHWEVLTKSTMTCSIYSVQIEPSYNFMMVFNLLNLVPFELGNWCNIYQRENLFENAETVKMAKFFLNSYMNEIKKNKPEDTDLRHLSEYAKNCILQLWDEDIVIIAQCLGQF